MSDGEPRRWAWIPGEHDVVPRLRDAEERIRTNSDRIDYLREDMESIRSIVSSARKGIWTLVIQTAVAILGALAMYLFVEVL